MSDSDELFVTSDPIFARKELLEINHLPQKRRIVGRDTQINAIADAVNPAVFEQSPSNILIYGKTGTGKSLCVKYVSQQLVETAEQEDVTAAFAYVDCAQESTETQTVQTIATSLNNSSETEITIPDRGIATSSYYDRLWAILDQQYDVVLIILDELDKLADDSVLMQLSRAGEAGKVQNVKIGVIGISNKIKYKDKQLSERVRSSLCEREFVFPPYDATQLNKIMTARKDAFQTGVLQAGVIPKAAALAAREHGDARQAIDILRYAGEIAQTRDVTTVNEKFVIDAREQAETDRFRELLAGSTPHSRYVLQALTIISLNHDERTGFRTTRIYEVYQQVCRQNGSDPLSLRRVRDLLKEHAFLDLTKQTRHSGGSADGAYINHQLLEDPEMIKTVLTDTAD